MKSELADSLIETFSGLTLKIIENHLNNQHRDSRGYRHNDEAKKFAMTLHFYSPRAYEYLRSVFSFPHPSSPGHWTNSINNANLGISLTCLRGFLKLQRKPLWNVTQY